MGKINSIQFCSILIMIILQTFFGLKNNIFTISILNLLLNFIIGLITIYIFIHIFSFKKELPINDKIKLLFNTKTCILINIILIICYLNISTAIFYNLNTFIMKQYLDKTPLFIIGILFLLIIVYINTKGFETLSRVSLILLFFTFISILISSLSLFEYINLNNLKLSNNIYISSNIYSRS